MTPSGVTGRFPTRGLAAALLLALGLGGFSDAARPEATGHLPAGLLRAMVGATDVEDFRRQVVGLLDRFERVEGTVLRSDLAIADARDVARRRAAFIGYMMAFDANEDGQVTEAEFKGEFSPRPKPRDPRETLRWYNDQTWINNRLVDWRQYDSDHNGVVDFAEVRSDPRGPRDRSYRDEKLLAVLMLAALDPNDDGRLTHAEAEGLAGDLFAAFDSDKDGKIAGAESEALSAAFGAALDEAREF